jgi:histo-blood group ABO system transferase
MKIALCVIATGKYTRFLPCLLESAEKFFCRGHDVRLFVFTDSRFRHRAFAIRHLYAPHEPWPGPTLHRYRTLLTAEAELLACDYIYYVDVDSRFVRPVGEEIFGDLTATIHYGFCESPRREFTYEDRPASRACVRPREGRRYYCGGFQGGRAKPFIEAMLAMDAAIAADERRRIVACWHDESHWNRYLIDHRPAVELSHDYCCPGQWRPETQRIVIVGKNNREMREPGRREERQGRNHE